MPSLKDSLVKPNNVGPVVSVPFAPPGTPPTTPIATKSRTSFVTPVSPNVDTLKLWQQRSTILPIRGRLLPVAPLNVTSTSSSSSSSSSSGTGPQGPPGPAGASGAPGTRGTIWFSGTGNPTSEVGQMNGDWYLDTATGNVWELIAGTWTQEGNIAGPIIDYPFNIVKYGAVADGVTDNTTAISAAITAAAAASGTVFVPNGVFAINTGITLPVNVSLFMSPNAELLAGASMTSVIVTGPTSGTTFPTQQSIQGGIINANGKATNGIYIRSCYHYTILNLSVLNVTGVGILVGDITDFAAGAAGDECYIGNVVVQVSSGSSATVGIYVTGAITDCRVTTAVVTGFVSGVRCDAGGCWFSDVHAYSWAASNNMTQAFYDNGTYNVWDNCYADTPLTYGFYLSASCTFSTIRGCAIFVNTAFGVDNTVIGIYSANATPQFTLVGVTFHGSTSIHRLAADIGNVTSFVGSTMCGLIVANVVSVVGGKFIFRASTTNTASFSLPIGSAPTTPVAGDIWAKSGGTSGGTLQWYNGAHTVNILVNEGGATPTVGHLGAFGDTGVTIQDAGLQLGYVADSGVANAYVVTLAPVPPAYAAGLTVIFKAGNSNTTASTINVNSLGTKSIVKNGSAALAAGDIVAGQVLTVTYDGTNFQMQSPAAGTPSAAGVTSFNGRTGAVVPTTGDYTAAQVTGAASQAGVQAESYTYAADTGAANAYVVTLSPVPGSYTAGLEVVFKAANANSGSSTLNVNGLGTVTIFKLNGSTTLASGDIAAGQIVTVIHDGTHFQMASPVANTSSFTSGSYPFVNLTPVTGSGFGWQNQGSASVVVQNGVMVVSAPGTGGDNIRFYGVSLPSTPWTVIAAFLPSHGQWNGGMGGYGDGLLLTDGTKYRSFWMAYQSVTTQQANGTPFFNAQGYDNATTYNSGQNIILRNWVNGPILWTKVHDDGTTRSYYLSVDPTNQGWVLLGTETHTNYLTPTKAGVGLDIYTSGLNGVTIPAMPLISWSVTTP